MRKFRIVRRVNNNSGEFTYIIQRKILFWWEDCEKFGYKNSECNSFDEAENNLCYFNGSMKNKFKEKDLIVK
jgi:hypothetical protein